VAAGLPVDDPSHYGDWIADIERPASQYRGRYQLRYDDAHALLRDGGGSKAAAALEQAPGAASGGGGARAGQQALEAVSAAQSQLGVPYVWGGESPGKGFDCSGLVQWAYAKAGISIPRVTDQQILASSGTPVARDKLLPGDLVFLRDKSGYVHHVAMSLGGDRIIEAPYHGQDVRVWSLNDPKYVQEYAGARRFAPDAPPVSKPNSDVQVLRAVRPEN
jgi:cell wall-associated NlpC family hydrolase